MTMKINSGFRLGGYSLTRNQKTLAQSIERMATGRQINRASDDAAGMTIANRLSSQARGMGQAMKNASDALSLSQVADGALGRAADLVQSIREKAVQAASAAQSPSSLGAIQSEIDQSLSQLTDLSQQTRYNGQPLLSGRFTDKRFQVGTQAGQEVTLSLGSVDPSELSHSELGSLADIDVTTMEGAQAAIQVADAALGTLSAQRASLAAGMNRLESGVANLSSTRINTLAAESEIRDLDFAEESVNLNRLKLLARARSFAQAQAGKADQQIVDLFG